MRALDISAIAAAFPWLTFSVSLTIAFGSILVFAPLARRMGWVDRPSLRKVHVGEVPLIGGWGILLGIAAAQWAGPSEARAPSGFWIGALLLFIVATIDDRRPVRARYRLLVQVVAALAGLSIGGAQHLPHLGDLFGTGVFASWWIVAPVIILGTVGVINAVNFTDGMDGLCGGVGLIGLFWFMVALTVAAGQAERVESAAMAFVPSLIPLAAAVMGGLAAFLFFNLRAPWRRTAAVFMGDSGSMLIGFMLAWFAVHVTFAFDAARFSPVACLWIMAVPLADTASCIVRRLFEGGRPMAADLKHLHHLLRRCGLSISQSVLLIHAACIACGLVGVAGWWLGIADAALLTGFVLLLVTYIGTTTLAWRVLETQQAGMQAASVASPSVSES